MFPRRYTSADRLSTVCKRLAYGAITLAGLALVGCSSGGGGGTGGDIGGTLVPESEQRVIAEGDVRAYRSGSPYADVLKNCIVVVDDPCTLAVLPYIGQEHDNPSVANIMDRVLVTHDWMGLRFEQILYQLPAETLALFKPLTAVLIGSEVRPSTYWSKYGRIKLDPANLWLSKSEKVTVSQAPDYREEFGSALKFDSYWRMVKDNDYAWDFFSLSDDSERQLKDITLRMARLLFHELAHANDYIPPAAFANLEASDTPRSATDRLYSDSLAIQLYDEALNISAQSSPLYPLARTLYRDEEISDELAAYTGQDAGAVMAGQGKATFYGYSSIQEDIATLFAQSLMRRYYGVETHTAFIDLPADQENATCVDYLIGWGSTNRMAASRVAVRAEWVMKQIMGDTPAIDSFFQRIGSEGSLPMGVAWCRSLETLVAADGLRARDDVISMEEFRAMERDMFPSHH